MLGATGFILLSVLVSVSWGHGTFPGWFKFGAATAAYTIEGAWNVSDKGPSVWDIFTHNHQYAIVGGSNGDVACDSYHLWQRDVEMAVEMGLDFYSFSLTWSRILPNGFPNHVSVDGARYYSDLIDELLKNGIEPVVVLNLLDLPKNLQNLGGWANPLIADWFADYSRVVFSLYGGRVKTWITIKDPSLISESYYFENFAPKVTETNVAGFVASKNVLMAHAKAWRIYDEEYRPKYGGKVAIGSFYTWFEPATPEDEGVTELAREYWNYRFLHPIYSEQGGWPQALYKYIEDKSEEQGYFRSRLPCLTKEEIEFIRGTYDFIDFKYDGTRKIRRAVGLTLPVSEKDLKFASQRELGILVESPEWEDQSRKISPEYYTAYIADFRKQISLLRDMYGDLEFLVSINWIANREPGLEDHERVEYLHLYLKEIASIVNEGKVNITSCGGWFFMDNFMWTSGYSLSGLYAVDFNSPERTRTPRDSARYYANVIRNHSVVNVTDLVDSAHFVTSHTRLQTKGFEIHT